MYSRAGQEVSLDVRNPEFYLNPYPIYSDLQATCPVFFWKNYGLWTFVKHQDIDAILRDKRFGRALDGCPLTHNQAQDRELDPFFEADRYSLLNLEPPDHPRIRSLVQRSFMNSRIGSYGQVVTNLAESLCDQIAVQLDRGEDIDIKKAFAEPIPVLVIAQMLGIPAEAKDDLLRWSHAMVRMYEPDRERKVELDAAQASQEFNSYLNDLIDERSGRAGDDLISLLLLAAEKEDRLSREEVVSTIILLLNAGHEATVNIISNAAVALMQNPRQMTVWKLLKTQEELEMATAELLRYDTPLHIFNRYVLEDLEFEGQSFKRGQVVSLVLGAGNRDVAAFEDPHRLDLTRKNNAHLSFGRGIHFCLGAPLAKLELHTSLQVLFRRFPHLALAGAPTKANTYHFHGYEEVWVNR